MYILYADYNYNRVMLRRILELNKYIYNPRLHLTPVGSAKRVFPPPHLQPLNHLRRMLTTFIHVFFNLSHCRFISTTRFTHLLDRFAIISSLDTSNRFWYVLSRFAGYVRHF